MTAPERAATIIVYCRDGRQFDLTGLTPDAAIDQLCAHGITPADILETVHRLPLRATRPSPRDA